MPVNILRMEETAEASVPAFHHPMEQRADTFDVRLADYEAYAVENWDGYDALPITAETLHAARSILKSLPKTFDDPVCSPGADGSIVFEWLKDDGPLRKLFTSLQYCPARIPPRNWGPSPGLRGARSEPKPDERTASAMGQMGISNGTICRRWTRQL